ncbi:hypothetical protein NQ314_011732 [Rhamnusium bicolor]|uniref:Chitin-binding type-2 domain-containing protein n=1 Tax=Rhamnusium bicolor TaxID=1586634 RepID=A0AAV8XGU7_9CUCU|nr:hypothetical protein NQ314_011732 [Rhamnusium bicolor]
MGETSEIVEPFSSGSSDNYVPESESSEENDRVEAENVPRLGLKRIEKLWIVQNGGEINYFLYPEYGQRMAAVIQGQSATTSFTYLKANFNLSFGSPRSDLCKICDQFGTERKIVVNEEEKIRKKVQHDLNLSKADSFFKELKVKSFILCGAAGNFVMDCPANLLFNGLKNYCDYPRSAGCCEFIEKNSSRLVQNSV